MQKFITMEKTFNLLKKPWAIAICLLLIFFSYHNIDRSLALFFYELDLRANMNFLNWFTALGKWTIYLVLFSLAGLYYHFINKNATYEKNSWFLLACLLIPNFLGLIIKVALSRARPELLFTDHLYGFYWFKLDSMYWSFPSGHAITITALAAGVGALLPRWYSLLILVALLVACSRVMLYYHFLSDVLAGFYLSILAVGVFSHYFHSRISSSKIQKSSK